MNKNLQKFYTQIYVFIYVFRVDQELKLLSLVGDKIVLFLYPTILI